MDVRFRDFLSVLNDAFLVYFFLYLAIVTEHPLWPGPVSGMVSTIDSVPVFREFAAHGTDSPSSNNHANKH